MGAGTLKPVELAVVVLTPLAAFEATQALSNAGIQLVRSGKAAQRIFELLDAANKKRDIPPRPADIEESGLTVRDLVIGWPDGPDVAGAFSFDVERGHSLAIVGASGIGKTTLLYTLAGMLHPHVGHVRLDGKEVSYLSRQEVSRSLILTAEDAHIFESSVLENIRVARPDLSPNEAIEVLGHVGLGDWLAQLPQGVHTHLGSDAATISGGERRRLLLARALASPAQYLLLDEPGEHLDSETADTLIRDLLRAGHNDDPAQSRTVILVTHRLQPLDAADRIVLLGEKDGKTMITASGSHEELLSHVADYRWSTQQEV